ncbi:hypothetical protein E4J66_07895 [Actinomyces viscosus]|uniref:Uncharacterized protein n=1 Tax=Actinomyces viscosus TaxID=1656 RepID=A0A3S4Z2P4_ACTVI|nr:hypothetical protein [Actinomyces viscosus]TFH52424.1 hypothetical protein E4J66_07895 [Actinomyces viscosus]VEI17179.1 Uncharacterised protein [Actinomyces viscosus]
MTATVRRSGFTIPLSLVVLTSTAMLLAGCQSGGASNANQQGTAGSSSSSSAKSQSTASAKPTSGQKSGHASPRIPSPTGKGSGESSAPQASSGSGSRPSSPRANEPRPAASGTGANKAATPGKTGASSSSSPSGQNNGGSSASSEAGGAENRAGASPQAQSAAPEAQASPEPASPTQAPADGSGNADQTTPAPAPTEPADPATPQAGQATSFVPDNLVSEKTAMVVSPSGNIGCDLSAHFAGCGVLSYRSDGTYGQDEMGSPKWWFDLSSGDTPQLGGRSEGAFSLDEFFRGGGSSPQVIEYGQSVTFGSWVCSSEETGMTCRNTETGHGVFLSSARYETF